MNIPLLDMIKQVPTYAKFLKDLCTIKKGLGINKKAFLTEQVCSIIQSRTLLKYKDPGSPTISVNIGGTYIDKALLDLGACVNLLPYSMYKQLGFGELKPTNITLTDKPKMWCVKCTPMCASACVAPSNVVYQWYGYLSTGIGVLTTEICFSNIIWIYVLCERLLESECKLN